MRRVLELRGFRRLLLGSLLNQLAYEIGVVALSLLVYKRTGSAMGAAAFFLCSEFAPALAGPALVARLDQLPARQTLALLYGAEVAVFLVLAWVVHHFSVAATLALTLVMGTLALVARVISRATWTAITFKVDLLREAQALTNTASSIAFMAGPALGGALVAAGGTRAALLVNGGVFGAMALNILTATGLPPSASEREPARGRLRRAVAFARGEPLIRRLLGLQAAGIVFFTLSIPVEVVFARRSLHTGASGYGGLLSAWGAGAIVGSLIYGRWRRLPSRATLALGSALLGVGFGVMAAAPSLAVAVVGAALAGVGNGVQVVAARTALQEAVPERWMALIVSINEALMTGVPGAGIALGGAIAALAGPRAALAVAAVGTAAVAVAVRAALPARLGRGGPETAAQQRIPAPDATLTVAAPRR
jgi:predicted MFS family arabinose efflux permease